MSGFRVRFAAPPACALCGTHTLLQVRHPHSWDNAAGKPVRGLKESALCPGCHRGRPAAEELLALFATDEQLNSDNAPAFADLLAAWLDEERQRVLDTHALPEEPDPRPARK